MADKPLTELLNYKPVVTASPIVGSTSGLDDFFKNFSRIVGEVKTMLKEYNDLQSMLGGGQQVDPYPHHRQVIDAPKNLPNEPVKKLEGGNKVNGFKVMAKAFLEDLEKRGYGDVPVQAIILNKPITVTQAINFINNPASFVQFLLSLGDTLPPPQPPEKVKKDAKTKSSG